MALPLLANTTCDIYRMGSQPPLAPSVAGVPCHLQADWRAGQEAGERGAFSCWTHLLHVDLDVDIRDGYIGQGSSVTQDSVYIPDQNGTQFLVIFIERVQRGTPHEHKRVYLDRQQPNWPTNDL